MKRRLLFFVFSICFIFLPFLTQAQTSFQDNTKPKSRWSFYGTAGVGIGKDRNAFNFFTGNSGEIHLIDLSSHSSKSAFSIGGTAKYTFFDILGIESGLIYQMCSGEYFVDYKLNTLETTITTTYTTHNLVIPLRLRVDWKRFYYSTGVAFRLYLSNNSDTITNPSDVSFFFPYPVSSGLLYSLGAGYKITDRLSLGLDRSWGLLNTCQVVIGFTL
ncbi:MAG: outer membrane beta-barrel protein [Rikenellaceae bacterium]|jgi:hypothetical protein|nr:outer membrane beta-barrel protein [Rikenellaceae bacterium]